MVDSLYEWYGSTLGNPLHFGNIPAEIKYFIDSTIPFDYWHFGWETRCCFCVKFHVARWSGKHIAFHAVHLIHHGRVLMGMPYIEPDLMSTKSGGAPDDLSHLAGSDSKLPVRDEEKIFCRALGKRLVGTARLQ